MTISPMKQRAKRKPKAPKAITGANFARVAANQLHQALAGALACVATDDTRPVLARVLLQVNGRVLDIVAADGFQMCHYRLPLHNADMPAHRFDALLDADDVKLMVECMRYGKASGSDTVMLYFLAELADWRSTGEAGGWYQPASVAIEWWGAAGSPTGGKYKGKPVPERVDSYNQERFPDWQRIVPTNRDTGDGLSAVVRVQIADFFGMIPKAADYAELWLKTNGIAPRFVINAEACDGTLAGWMYMDAHSKNNAPMIKGQYIRGSASEPYLNVEAMRAWLADGERNGQDAGRIDVDYIRRWLNEQSAGQYASMVNIRNVRDWLKANGRLKYGYLDIAFRTRNHALHFYDAGTEMLTEYIVMPFTLR